jgi:hypothetical protein
VASLDFDLIAASLRADASDLAAFVESLAVKLEEALPGRAKVQRARRGLLGPKVVRSITLDVGDQRLGMTREDGDQVELSRARVSGGIVIKSETLDTEAWLAELSAAMVAEAERSEQTRQALQRLLID